MTTIHILPPEEARKIAAGEVIDRPAALVREFLDNALDSGARTIEVFVEGGGIAYVEVSDDGRGMDSGDLELCCLTHATSKIRNLEDLSGTRTLGFRGEALAAAAAVSRVEILSSRDGREAWKLETGPGKEASVRQAVRVRGTSVRSAGLFDAVPGRKRFLKRPGSEAAACHLIFCDKAMAFPDTCFRFTQDRELKTFLPAIGAPQTLPRQPEDSAPYKARFAAITGFEPRFLHEITTQGHGFRVIIVFGGPELARKDRRSQYIFTNGRRIQDFSLNQALEYGLRGVFPNGTHPAGAVFIDIDPALADFNVHPAKREVRFADPAPLHRSITSTLENFRHMTYPALQTNADTNAALAFPAEPAAFPAMSGGERFEAPRFDYETSHFDYKAPRFEYKARNLAIQAAADTEPSYSPFVSSDTNVSAGTNVPEPKTAGAAPAVRFLGQLFGLFLLVERGNKLFIIDQHAAHERVLYDGFLAEPIRQQELLVPIPFTTESAADDAFLEARQEELERLGISLCRDTNGWRVEALPADWRLSDADTITELLSLKNAGKNLAEHWAATLSCRSALMDGAYLDPESARALAQAALGLPDPHCPHGRPIWVEIQREELFRLVKRA